MRGDTRARDKAVYAHSVHRQNSERRKGARLSAWNGTGRYPVWVVEAGTGTVVGICRECTTTHTRNTSTLSYRCNRGRCQVRTEGSFSTVGKCRISTVPGHPCVGFRSCRCRCRCHNARRLVVNAPHYLRQWRGDKEQGGHISGGTVVDEKEYKLA